MFLMSEAPLCRTRWVAPAPPGSGSSSSLLLLSLELSATQSLRALNTSPGQAGRRMLPAKIRRRRPSFEEAAEAVVELASVPGPGPSTQRATKAFSAHFGSKVRYLIRRNPLCLYVIANCRAYGPEGAAPPSKMRPRPSSYQRLFQVLLYYSRA